MHNAQCTMMYNFLAHAGSADPLVNALLPIQTLCLVSQELHKVNHIVLFSTLLHAWERKRKAGLTGFRHIHSLLIGKRACLKNVLVPAIINSGS